ncbi:MAG TPA: hypothetical protein EYP04_05930 [Anaerolineae bacterium]|nr:hypothetical protein [Anaerolineae bacterium]HIQ04096.1 hypothetical protein [Anaerolineae bacterium]
MQWLDASGQPLGDPQLAVALHENAYRWRIIRRELTAPPNAAQANVILGARLNGQTLWVDDVALVSSPEPELPVQGTVTLCPPFTARDKGTREQREGGREHRRHLNAGAANHLRAEGERVL